MRIFKSTGIGIGIDFAVDLNSTCETSDKSKNVRSYLDLKMEIIMYRPLPSRRLFKNSGSSRGWSVGRRNANTIKTEPARTRSRGYSESLIRYERSALIDAASILSSSYPIIIWPPCAVPPSYEMNTR